MLIQRLFALLDKCVSELFSLQSWGTGDEKGEHQWIHFVDIGPAIGIVGGNGKIHTLMGYWSVRHYFNGNKLVRRIPIRRDLKEGERLATKEEIVLHQADIRRQFSEPHGGMISF